MAEKVEALVRPALLTWARETAGYTIEDIAAKLRVTPEKIERWERGEARPTIRQARRYADICKRPLAALYLSEPPREYQVLRDFRRLPDVSVQAQSPQLRFAIRQAHYRRDVALELYDALDETPATFELPVSMRDDPELIGVRIRRLLGVTYEIQREWHTRNQAFNAWRIGLESIGVLVFQASRIDEKEMRGFSISQFPLPVIVLNSGDALVGRIFTLLHEFVHIAIKEGGLCDPLNDSVGRLPEDEQVEIFCNHVAGATLVPMQYLLTEENVAANRGQLGWPTDELVALSNIYQVSTEVILRRLLIANLTSQDVYREKRVEFEEQRKQRGKPKEAGAPPYHRLVVSRAGRLFTGLVLQGYHQDHITASDVSAFLDTHLKHLSKIQAEVFT